MILPLYLVHRSHLFFYFRGGLPSGKNAKRAYCKKAKKSINKQSNGILPIVIYSDYDIKWVCRI